jgi:hypothetical protein
MPHCIQKINKFKIVVFPLKDSKTIGRGLLIEMGPFLKESVVHIPGPPCELFRPGMCP